MNFRRTLTVLAGTAFTLGLLSAGIRPAIAGPLHNGWTYSIDSFNDGTEWNASSRRLMMGENSEFEFYGMAYKETSDKIFFAINSNLSLDGYYQRGARNNRISYGDLFLNFSNLSSFNAANSRRELYAIRFDGTNDTGVQLGLYSNVQASSLTGANSGYGKIQDHTREVARYGGSASYGDMEATTSYFRQNQGAFTTINRGNYVGEVSLISDVSNLGLDFAHFNAVGDYTFGFSVDRSALPTGDFVASLFAECGNDGIVLEGETKDVPEPSAMVGLVAAGLMFGGTRLRLRRQAV